MEVPEIAVAPGFVLRPWRLDDVEVVREASRDPYIPLISSVPAEFTEAEAEAFLRRQWQRAEEGVGYSFAIAVAGHAVGQMGLWPGPHERASVGYWIAPSARGKGIVVAALDALSRWGLTELPVARLELQVEPWNIGSWKAAERAGYEREGLLRSWMEIGGERKDMYMYSRLAQHP
ncbi:GNAT family N-acetyltransferase [Nonomuraea sp. NPDC050328]|uniref:GNAT family N-acetyltransferase n=1 Tax=Nonomuraea sp. NPDC050328 TaxID=3364361 RepID=UPI0037A0700C